MDKDSDYSKLFQSFRIAGRAFRRIQRCGSVQSDRDLVRNPDYQQLHRAGMQIALMGGEAAIRGAIDSICSVPAERRSVAKAELERMWDGMGRWRN